MKELEDQNRKIIKNCFKQLQTIYTHEQATQVLLILSTILYLPKLDNQLIKPLINRENINIEALMFATKEIEQENPIFEGILTGLLTPMLNVKNKFSTNILKNVMEDLEFYTFHFKHTNDLINSIAFSFENEKSTTPETISKLVFKLNNFNHNISFADYCSGLSSVAISLFKKIKSINNHIDFSYYGEESNMTVFLISKLLMIINKIEKSIIINKDVLDITNAKYSFDLIFSDAPFGVKWDKKRIQNDIVYEYGAPLKASAEWFFYQKILCNLDYNGKAFVIGTKGTLVRKSETHIRKEIIEKDLIEAIISLPSNLYSNTNIGAELIIFNHNKKNDKKNKILFIDASSYSVKLIKNQYEITDEGIEKIANLYFSGKEEKKISKLIDIEKISDHNFSLNTKEYIDYNFMKERFGETIKLGKVAKITRGIQLKDEEYELLKKEPTHFLLNVKDIENGYINYDENSKISYKKNEWIEKFAIQPSDILITSKGSNIKFAIVDQNFKNAFISGNLSIIRLNTNDYDVYVLYEFLQSKIGRRMIDGIQTGTTIKLVNPSKLEELEIPKFSIESMNRIGEKLKQNKIEYESIIKKAESDFKRNQKTLIKKLNLDQEI